MKRLLSCILASLLFLSGTAEPAFPGAEAAPAVRLLLIGCDYFMSQPNTAPVSENNVRTVENVWADGMNGDPAILRNVNGIGSREDLQTAVDTAFRDSAGADVNICYISTHGVLPEDGDPSGMTLLFSDGRREVNVTPEELRSILDTAEGRKILILDACYSGAVIGKGAPGLRNAFDSPEYTVITSSGAAERSWFWSATGDTGSGVGYFTGSLALAMNADDGYPADTDRDGVITLSELKRMLEHIHGVTAFRTWPEQSDTAILECAPEAGNRGNSGSAVTGLRFDSRVPDPVNPSCGFSFTVNRPVRLIYRMVGEKDGEWDFTDAAFLFDDAEDGAAVGVLEPGHRERVLTPGIPEDGNGGYVLLQIIGMADGVPRLYGTHVICIPAAGTEQAAAAEILIPERFGTDRENNFTVRLAAPCSLTVSVVDEEGKTVCYPAVDRVTRPEGIHPEGMSLCWNGTDRYGNRVPAGTYRIRVRIRNGSRMEEVLSESFTAE